MSYNDRAEEILRDWSLESFQDEDCGHVDETGFWAAIFRGPLKTGPSFHVRGLPADGYTWQTPPLSDLTTDFGDMAAAERVARNLRTAGIVPTADVQTLAQDEETLELAALHPAAVGFILECDDRGNYYYRAYSDKDALEKDWAGLMRADLEARGPDEEDAVISSNGFVLSVSYGSEFLGEFAEDDDARAALRAAMERDGYFPNVWEISDHGNVSLISEDFYKETEHLAKGEN